MRSSEDRKDLLINDINKGDNWIASNVLVDVSGKEKLQVRFYCIGAWRFIHKYS